MLMIRIDISGIDNRRFGEIFDGTKGRTLGAQYVWYTPADAEEYRIDKLRDANGYPEWCRPESPARIGSVTVVNRHNKKEVGYWDPVVDGDFLTGWEYRHGNCCVFDGD